MAAAVENPSSFWLAKAAIAKNFANRKPPVDLETRDQLCLIASRLYLSSCHLEAQKELLKRSGVTHVLQVGKELSPTHPASFTYKHVPVYDLEEEDLVKYFPECFNFINAGRENGAVLVHCAAGVSRSASVVIAYLMATGGLSLEDARAAVKASRPAINPNQGFLLQLQLFQEARCSAEGWQHWDLERFLRVRSAAYARNATSASLAAAAPESSDSLMRGACELTPPVLNREDSISPSGSPSHSPERGYGSQGPLLASAGSGNALSSLARPFPSSCNGAAVGGGQTGAVTPSSRGEGGIMAGPGQRLPMLPDVGAAATGATATRAAIVAASGDTVTAARWPSTIAAVVGHQDGDPRALPLPLPLAPSLSLQRQRSAGDSVVTTALVAARPAAQSLPSIGVTVASPAAPDMATGGFASLTSDRGGTNPSDFSYAPAESRHLGDSSGPQVGTSSNLGSAGGGPATLHACRTASGIADAAAQAACRAVLGSLHVGTPGGERPADAVARQAAAAAVHSGTLGEPGHAGPAGPAARAAGCGAAGGRPHDGGEWSHGRRSVVTSSQVMGRASYFGGMTPGSPPGAAITVPDPRALVSPACPAAVSQGALQASFDTGAPLVLSPIPSDGGCSDGGCRSENDDDGGGDRGVAACIHLAGSARQLRAENEAPPLLRDGGGGVRRGFLRRSLSDRLQGVLAKAFPGLAPAALGADTVIGGGGGSAVPGGPSRPGALSGDAAAGLDSNVGRSGGSVAGQAGGAAAAGQGQPYVPTPLAPLPPGTWVVGGLEAAVTTAPAAAPRLSADSGASGSALTPVWPDASGSDGSTNSSSTTSQVSAADGAFSSGGGSSACEERSDATSGVAGGGGGGGSSAAASAGGRSRPAPHDGDAGGSTPIRAGSATCPASPDASPVVWALGHHLRAALVPILTPAGLERTPSKVPQTPPASACAFTTGAAEDGSLARGVAAGGLRLPTSLPEASPPLLHDSNDDGGSAAARSAALSHLVAVNALSHGAASAAAVFGAIAVGTEAAGVRSDAEITALRTPSIGSAAVSPRCSDQPWAKSGDPMMQGAQHGNDGDDGAGGNVTGTQCSSGRAAAGGGGAHVGLKAASRLATATFAHPACTASGSGWTAGVGGRSESSFVGVGARLRAGVAAAIAATNHNEDRSVCSGIGMAGEPQPYRLQRCSAPSVVTSGLLASAGGVASAAALPPGDAAISPPPAVAAPIRSLRLSIRNLQGGGHGRIGAAAAISATADSSRADGGAGTPIHKRVLRSLTSFLSRSPESPTAIAASDGTAAAGGSAAAKGHDKGGDGAGYAGGGAGVLSAARPAAGAAGVSSGAGASGAAALRRRLWGAADLSEAAGQPSGGVCAVAASVAAAADVSAAAMEPYAIAGGFVMSDDDEVEGAAGQVLPGSVPDGRRGCSADIHAAVLLPPAASSIPGNPTGASDARSEPVMATAAPPPGWPGLTCRTQVGVTDGTYGSTLGNTSDGGDSGAGGYMTAAASSVGRMLLRSRSSSPTCAVAAAAHPFVWPSGGGSAGSASAPLEPGPRLAAVGWLAGADAASSTAEQRTLANAPAAWGEEEEGEEVIGLDMLPDVPFRWSSATGGQEWQPMRPVAAPAAAAVNADDGVASAAAAAGAAAALDRGNLHHYSLDGRRHCGADNDVWQVARPAAASTSTSAVAVATAYRASLASVASAVLLAAPSDGLELEGAPPNPAVAAAAPAAAATTSAPALDAINSAVAWWQAPGGGGGSYSGGGGIIGIQRAASVGAQALPPPSASVAAHNRRSEGLALLGPGGIGADVATRGCSAVPPVLVPPAGSSASSDASGYARRPRSSYSGALSMLTPGGGHGRIASRPGAGSSAHAGAPGPGAPLHWRPQLPSGDPPPPLQTQGPQGTLAPSPLLSPLSHMPPLVAALPPPPPLPPQQQQQEEVISGERPYFPAARAAAACSSLAMPAWGGSRSSACLMTMPSDPELSDPGTTGRPQHRSPAPDLEEGRDDRQPPEMREPPHQAPRSQRVLRKQVDELGVPGQGARPPSHFTVRSSSTGSSAAAHAAAAAAGSLAVDNAWDQLGAVRKHHHHHHHLQLHYPQTGFVLLPHMSGKIDAADHPPTPGATPTWSRTAATMPLLELASGPLSGGPPRAAGDTSPAAGAAAGDTAASGSSAPEVSLSISPSSAAAAVMAVRIPLSPTASSRGSSAGVQSPRALPAVSSIPELDPLLTHDELGASSPAMTALLSQAAQWRASDAASALSAPVDNVGSAAAPGRGWPDPSLLRPVLGRCLLPMPSPSRIVAGSPGGTPRGSAGGAGALHPPHSQPPPSVGAAAAMTSEAAAAGVAAVAAPPSAAPPEPRPAIHTANLRVLLPHELKAAGGAGGGGRHGGSACSARGTSARAPQTAGSTAAGLETAGLETAGDVASCTPPRLSGCNSSGGGAGNREQPAGSPGESQCRAVRSPSAVCGSHPSSDDGGPAGAAS